MSKTRFTSIHGNVRSMKQIGELTLTETAYPPNFQLSQHAHEMACLGVMISGGIFEEFALRKLSYNAHTAYFRPPQVTHKNHTHAMGATCFNLEVSSGWLENVQEYGRFPSEPTTFEGGQLNRLAYEVYKQWKSMDEVAPLVIEGLAYEIAAELCRTSGDKTEPHPPRWLKGVQEIVRSRFAESFSLAEIAQEVGRHPVHVAREFRRYYGRTVGQLKRECRINHACERLAHSELPIVDIALEAGFAQQAHFSTVFRQMTRLTPSEYKELHRPQGKTKSYK